MIVFMIENYWWNFGCEEWIEEGAGFGRRVLIVKV